MKKILVLSFLTFSSSLLTLSAQSKHGKAKPAATDTAKPMVYNGPKGCPNAMSADEFAGVKKTISGETDVDNVIVVAKKEAVAHCFTTGQVKALMKYLKSDDNRFEFFKAVYPHIYDLRNYPDIGDSFTDKSYSQKMKIYVNSLE